MMSAAHVKKLIYAPKAPVDRVLSDLYRRGTNFCLICERGKLLGVLTLSDIKQALLRGVDPQVSVGSIMNTSYTSAPHGTPVSALEKMAHRRNPLRTGRIERVPLVDKSGALKGLYALPSTKRGEKHTVLVTGGAGYIGSHLVRHLLKDGFRVVVLDKLLFGDEGIRGLEKHRDFTLIRGDIGDIGTLVGAVARADSVIHLAGIVGDPASALSPMQTMEENHFATKTLIDLCRHYQVSRFVFASSCSVYGASPARSNEESKLYPVSLYAQSKMYSERELLEAAGESFNPVILRFGTVYGLSPRMRFDLVVNTMTAHAHTHGKITVDGGSQWRPLLHVEDAARACLAALKAPLHKVSGQIFNVGDSGENYRIKDIATHVQRHLPAATIDHLDTVKDRRDYIVSFKKIRRVMGYSTKHKIRAGIGEVARELRRGKFKDWRAPKYNNYLTLRNVLEKMSP